jgi:hypothetical protein
MFFVGAYVTVACVCVVWSFMSIRIPDRLIDLLFEFYVFQFLSVPVSRIKLRVSLIYQGERCVSTTTRSEPLVDSPIFVRPYSHVGVTRFGGRLPVPV